jgi:hypothetical protein
MDWQTLAAGVLVAGCSAWSAWTLMPAAMRTRCRRLPAAAELPCAGCRGCGRAASSIGAEQVVRTVKQLGRG